MTRYFTIFLLVGLLVLPLSSLRFWPHFDGQSPEVAEYVKEYKSLAHARGLNFRKEVTIGFEEFEPGPAIGRCFRTPTFREIALDDGYWQDASHTTHRMLMFHELTHCYCARGHKEGELEDGCPLSIMAAQIMTDQCALTHSAYYIEEMFRHCKPYK